MTTHLLLHNATLHTPTETILNAAIHLANGRLHAYGPADLIVTPPATPTLDATGLIAVPGFIDLQLNGGFGHDFTADPTTLWDVAAQLPRYGVTAFLPTLITCPLDVVAAAQAVLAAGPPPGWRGARPLGWHVEGPFLNPAKKGAHNPDHMQRPSPAAVRHWTPADGVRLVTLAPELPGALETIAQLVANGVVVSLGHSLADAAQTRAALDAGATAGTHLFNAMPPLHHRRPALPGALLADERATVGLIADHVHVAPELLKLAWRTLGPDRLCLVSDAMAALGMDPGVYNLGDQSVAVGPTAARLADGTLAGSTTGLNRGLVNLATVAGISLPAALPTVTTTPAALLGLDGRYGRLLPGHPADLVLLDVDGRVTHAFIAGEVVYTRFN